MNTLAKAGLTVAICSLPVVSCSEAAELDNLSTEAKVQLRAVDEGAMPAVEPATFPARCAALTTEDALLDPFGEPVRILYDFDKLIFLKGAEQAEIETCISTVLETVEREMLSRDDVGDVEVVEIVFYSLTTFDEYDAGDASAMHFQHVAELTRDGDDWERGVAKTTIDTDIWGRVGL